MNKNSSIYVAGHTGLIGSAILRRLRSLGFKKIIVRTHDQLDLTDKNKVEFLLKREKPEYVFLAAARVGSIYANSRYPAEFIYENLAIQTNVIDSARKHGVKKLLFLGSSCVYPKVCAQPIKEKYLLTGAIEPTNEPFAVAKIAGIEMCQAYNRQYGTNFISVIPANVYGVNDHSGEDAHVVISLFEKFRAAKAEGQSCVTVWGSGRPRREFLYVDDLADACIFLMNNFNSGAVINAGPGEEISIKELAGLIKVITGFKGKIIYDTSRPDGNSRRLLDSSKISSLGWKPRINLKQGLNMTWKWFKDVKR